MKTVKTNDSVLFRLLLLMIVTGNSLFSQDQEHNYIIDRFGIEHGLSQSVIKCVLQDSRGFLWIGTQDGLNRFDGYQFKAFKYDVNDTSSISHNTITTLFEDKRGRFWIGTQNGLNLFQHGKFIRFKFQGDGPFSVMNDNIISVCEGDSGYMWIGTIGGGLHRFDPDKRKFISYRHKADDSHSLPSNTIRSLCFTSDKTLWIGASRGLCRLANGRIDRIIDRQNQSNPFFTDNILVLLETGRGNLWAGSRHNGLVEFNPRNSSAENHFTVNNGLKHNHITSVYESNDGTLWVGTGFGGVHLFQNGFWNYFTHDSSNPDKTPNDEINSILKDHSGNLWVGTSSGLYRFKRNFFTIFRNDAPVSRKLPGNEVWAVYEDSRKRLWTAVHPQGLFMSDKNNTALFTDKSGQPNIIAHSNVYCIKEDRFGRIWIGAERGISVLDGKTIHTFRPAEGDSFAIPDYTVMAIEEDKNGSIWIATYGGGLLRWEPEKPGSVKGRFLTYRYLHNNPKSLSNDDVFTLKADKSGYLWIGTFNGLNRFDGDWFTRFHHNPDDRNSLSHNTVLSIHAADDGSVWIGTDGGGLNHYQDGVWTAFTKKDGLPNNVIYGILQDGDSNLWLSTNKGLSRFSLTKIGINKIQNFDTHDGLPSNEFNQNSYFKNKRGEMFFGGISGMIRFRPETIVPGEYAVPVYITAFKIFDRDALSEYELSTASQTDLSYKDNFFAFEFVALDYTTASKNRYAYQLVGFDNDWINSGTRRYASYTNLDGGAYVFRVKATNSHGVWNEQPYEIRVVIHPPFWETEWFRISALILVLSGLYALYRYRLHAIRRQNEELEQKVHERTKTIEEKNSELEMKNEQIRQHQEQLIQSEKLSSLGRLVSSMSHEINNPLNFTYGTISILEQDLKDLKELTKNAQADRITPDEIQAKADLLQTIKLGIERIRDIVVGMRNFSVMDESELIEIDVNTTISYLLSLIRSRDRQGVMIHTDLSELPVIQGLPGQLNHAILNILKNAIEFTQKRVKREETGNIWIKTCRENEAIVISVRDDGIGIPEEHRHKIFEPFFTTKGVGEGTGLGLAISYGVIQHHHGWIDYSSESGKGSEFKLYLPVQTQPPAMSEKKQG